MRRMGKKGEDGKGLEGGRRNKGGEDYETARD